MLDSLKLESEGLAIVAVGSFNPAIFHPSWFAAQNLIRPEEARTADIKIVHRQAAIFSIEWFSLQVTETTFNAETGDPTKSLPLRDLVIGTFQLLEHTPIDACGLNRYLHFRASSVDDWRELGDRLVPKQRWQGILGDPELQSLTITGKCEASTGAAVHVKIEPSGLVSPGVFIQIHQYLRSAVLSENGSAPPRKPMQMLADAWEDFLSLSHSMPDQILNVVKAGD